MSTSFLLGWDRPGNFGQPRVLEGPDEPYEFMESHQITCLRGLVDPALVTAAAPVIRSIQEDNWPGARSTSERQRQKGLIWPVTQAPAELLCILTAGAVREAVIKAHGTDDVRVLGWVIFHRPAREEGTFWHKDEGHMPFGGDIIQYWLPLESLPTGQGLKFQRDLGDGGRVYSFGGMEPGDMTLHRQNVWHAGQTYSADTTGVSFITYRSGAILEDHDQPVFHHARSQAVAALFPGLDFGDVAASDLTPRFLDLPQLLSMVNSDANPSGLQ